MADMSLINIDDYRDTIEKKDNDVWADIEAEVERVGGGALVAVPAWRKTFCGPAEEVRLPDGGSLIIVLSNRIPDGKGLLITPKGADDIEVRLSSPVDEGGGRLSVTVPIDAGPAPMRWAVPGPERAQ